MAETTIRLTESTYRAVHDKLETGEFDNEDQVIDAAIKALDHYDYEAKMDTLRNAVLEGKNSEIVHNFDPDKLLKEIHKDFEAKCGHI